MNHLSEARVLIVDDEQANIQLLARILDTAGYSNVRSTTDPRAVEAMLGEYDPDLVFLDLLMPGMDGQEVLAMIQSHLSDGAYLPVIILTSDHTPDARRRGLAAGAQDFLTKPLSPSEVRLRARNLLQTRFLHQELRGHNERLEHQVAERTAELESARLQTLLRLARAAEYRDDETGEHTKRVGRLAASLARSGGLPRPLVETIGLVAPLHDVGKIGIPDSILLSAERLSPEQLRVMQTHCQIGHALLSDTGVPLLDAAAEIALSHHECWDGSGYPGGLAGEAIPVSGRIVAIADTYDALRSSRPYKKAWPRQKARAEIEASAGRQLDPHLVEVFLAMRLPRTAAVC
jgi:cyclic di-GMP phosphodiesterase